MTHKQGNDHQSSFMDGISVKISEQYKPPPRITLPITYSQRLFLNKQIQDNTPDYTFVLEHKVKEQLEALKAARKSLVEEKLKRVERIEIERKRRGKEVKNGEEAPFYAMQDGGKVLVPVQSVSSGEKRMEERSSFNISDFEADTSSPFDNMELKSINDMEELAQVLKGEETAFNKSQVFPVYSTSANYVPTYNYGYNGNNTVTTPSTSPSFNSKIKEPEQHAAFNNRVPEVLKALENELQNFHLNNTYVNQQHSYHKKSIETPKDEDDLENPYSTLPSDVQEFACQVSSMGFPLSRVARACKLLGKDNKKVVEHLLAMTELMDMGFSEKDVTNALINCNYDRDKALDKLVL